MCLASYRPTKSKCALYSDWLMHNCQTPPIGRCMPHPTPTPALISPKATSGLSRPTVLAFRRGLPFVSRTEASANQNEVTCSIRVVEAYIGLMGLTKHEAKLSLG